MKDIQKTHNLTRSAIIAAIYLAVTFAQETLLPGSASAAVQFRAAEALTVLCLFTPSAVAGVTTGCVFSNLLIMGALPFDVVIGSFATFLSCILMRRLSRVEYKGVPFWSLLMPAVCNGVIIGAEIEAFFVAGSFKFTGFLVQGGLVALGELCVLFTLGTGLIRAIKNKNLIKYLA